MIDLGEQRQQLGIFLGGSGHARLTLLDDIAAVVFAGLPPQFLGRRGEIDGDGAPRSINWPHEAKHSFATFNSGCSRKNPLTAPRMRITLCQYSMARLANAKGPEINGPG